MNHGAFPISDLSTSPATSLCITDLSGKVNRRPDPNRLLTLYPAEPAPVGSVAFTRGGTYDPDFRPQPWDVVRRGRLLSEDGTELNIRRPTTVAGLDGLEAGKRYKVTVAVEKLSRMRWWWAGTEEEEEEESRGPLEFEVEGDGVEFRVEE